MNYELMWKELKAKIEKDLEYYDKGTMCSLMESVHGSANYSAVLKDMGKLEEKYKDG